MAAFARFSNVIATRGVLKLSYDGDVSAVAISNPISWQ